MKKPAAVQIRIEMIDIDGDCVAVSNRFYRDVPQCEAAWHRAHVALTEPPRSGRGLAKTSTRATPDAAPRTEGEVT